MAWKIEPYRAIAFVRNVGKKPIKAGTSVTYPDTTGLEFKECDRISFNRFEGVVEQAILPKQWGSVRVRKLEYKEEGELHG